MGVLSDSPFKELVIDLSGGAGMALLKVVNEALWPIVIDWSTARGFKYSGGICDGPWKFAGPKTLTMS